MTTDPRALVQQITNLRIEADGYRAGGSRGTASLLDAAADLLEEQAKETADLRQFKEWAEPQCEHYSEQKAEISRQQQLIERLRAALEGMLELDNLTLLGGRGKTPEQAYEAGANAAFSQAADIARAALENKP